MYHKHSVKSILVLVLVAALLAPSLVCARVPNDPSYYQQQRFYEQIKAPEAWNYATGSPKVIVAIIDTGVDIANEDLQPNIWQNPYEIPDNGIDDDHNDFIDDVNGWNFVESNNNVRPSVFDDQSDLEAVRHGTVIAGLIGAAGDNQTDGTGINWQVKIMPLRAVGSDGVGTYSDISQAIVYAVKNGAKVIGLSVVGNDMDKGFRYITRWAYDQGVLIVAAAGNNQGNGYGNLDDHPVYPACFDKDDIRNWVLGVTAVDSNDKLSYFADYGQCADIAAPGEDLYSSERYAPDYGFQNKFGGPWSGTSFAVPLVVGTAALIKSLHPEWGPSQIINTILDNADNIKSQNSDLMNVPKRLNIGAAVKKASLKRISNPTYKFGYQKDVVWYSTSTKKIALTSVSEAKILGLATADFSNGWKPNVTILLERKPYFYIRLLKDDGVFWREFSAQIPKGAANLQIRTIADAGDGARIVVSAYFSKTKKTIWQKYDLVGNLIDKIEYAGVINSWQPAADGAAIEAKIKLKNKLTTKRIEWYNN